MGDSADEYASPVRQAPSPNASPRRSPLVSSPRQPSPTLALTSEAGPVPEPEGTMEAVEEMGTMEEMPRETPQVEIPGSVPDGAQVARLDSAGASVVDEEAEAEELGELREISTVAAKLVEVSIQPLNSFCSRRVVSRADLVSLCRAWGKALRPRRPAKRGTRH